MGPHHVDKQALQLADPLAHCLDRAAMMAGYTKKR